MAHKEPDAPGVSGISSGSTVKLKDLAPAATNNVNTTFIVLDKAARAPPPPPHGRADAREETCLALVADETAAAHFLLWGAERDAFEPGDIVRLTGGIFSYHRSNSLVLRAGRRGRAEKVGEFTMLFVETPNMSEVKWVRDPGDPRRMVQEAVVSPHSQPDVPVVSGINSGSTVKLKDLAPAATNNVNTTFIVLDKAARAPPPPPHGRADAREETCLALVADETAAAHFLLWGAERDAFEPGDIVRLTGGIFSYHRSNSLVLRAGRRGRAEKVGEFTMLFVETPNMSEVKWVRDPGDPRRMVQEAVVSPHSQVFKPLQ
ncbi:hypothetical protein OsJ_24757 [Oryza sativa Japonica Group]|uniref:Uncharacterized protein n=1 Tax=Oryza sativa subsp. japonica TaxID=39947 RepID=A3BL72_ORYSJ|nr:hypothetical protein OsJ_24757 [Oryza sativa Japonica Group]